MEFGIGAGNCAGRPTRNWAIAKYLASPHGIIGPPAVGVPLTWGVPFVAGSPEGPVGNLGRGAAEFPHLEGEIEGSERPHAPLSSL